MYCSLILHILEAKVRANVWTAHRDKKIVCCREESLWRGDRLWRFDCIVYIVLRKKATRVNMYVNSQQVRI